MALAVGGAAAVLAFPVALQAIGFTSAGIAAGSFAASMMSAAAANGGGVAARSLVAFLQSAGAAGLSGAATTVLAGIGVGIGAGVGWMANFFQGKKKKNREEEIQTMMLIAGILGVGLFTLAVLHHRSFRGRRGKKENY